MNRHFLKKSALPFALVTALALVLNGAAFAADTASRVNSYGTLDPAGTALSDAYNAYKGGDYQSANILLRRALSNPQNQSDAALYMLVMSGIYSKDYKSAYADSEYFLQSYPNSSYAPLIKYQQGRGLFYMGEYDKAVLTLSDFCHENPGNSMYPSALFWMGECFFMGYNFEQAKPLYERIVNEYPKDPKAIEAKYRLDQINQRIREEKLLYLLQQTGESYLSSKENYEKALRRYELENQLGRPLDEDSLPEEESGASADEGLEDVRTVVRQEQPVLEKPAADDYNFLDALRRLKMSAAEAQGLLDGDGN